MIKKTYTVWSERVSGLLFSTNKKAKVFFLHGWGNWTKEKRMYLQKKLLDKWVSSFSFDFSGHGESTGILEEWSLYKRFLEAKHSIQEYGDSSSITICASSMGCHVAVKLLEVLPIKSLVLIAPAVYSKKAFNLPFNDWLTEELRREKSYLENDTMELFNSFDGNLRIVLWEEDTVIPSWVITLLKESTSHLEKRKIISYAWCPHKVHGWLEDNDDMANQLADEIVSIV